MDGAPIYRVLAKLPGSKRSGNGWRAKCPAHDDTHPSLSIGIGRDGRVLLCCHAGCSLEAVLTALGLSPSDLFPASDRPDPSRVSIAGNATPPPRRRIAKVYSYVDEKGQLRFQTVRLDPKGFYQRRPDGRGGWINDLAGVQRILYRLRELLAAPPGKAVWIPEGEKDADALAALGLVATTAAGGVDAPWLPQYTETLRDSHVVLLQDNDTPGRKRVWTIARALFGTVKSVRIVAFPDLPEKGDLSDWLAAGHTKAELITLARVTPPLTAADLQEGAGESSFLHSSDDAASDEEPTDGPPSPPRPSVPPFPDDVFPLLLRRYVLECAAALGVPVDMVAVPLLGFAAGVIGNTRVLRVKAGWIVRAILWLAVVGDPGSGKSPALDHARHPTDLLQKTAWDRFQAALISWEQAVLEAKQQKQLPPEKPVLEHFLTTDATMEALAVILGASPGVVLVRDELVGWVKSHDAYRKAGDRQQWLSLWAGAPLKVDRRTSGPIYVPKPTAVVVGGIQPDLLPELAAEANRRDGFIDRFLASWPDALPQRWTEATVSAATAKAAEDLFITLRPAIRVEESSLHDLSPAAKQAFAHWYDQNAVLREQASGLAAGCYAKYPGQCARIALVLHCLRYPEDLTKEVEEGTVLDAIAVIEYFRGHLARVLPAFGAIAPKPGPTAADTVTQRVARILKEGAGAWITRTELHARLGGSVEGTDLTVALQELEHEGLVEMRSVPTGARPREEWRWIGRPDSRESEPDSDDPHQESDPKNEEMKNSREEAPNSSYLHFFDNDHHEPDDGEPLQETYL